MSEEDNLSKELGKALTGLAKASEWTAYVILFGAAVVLSIFVWEYVLQHWTWKDYAIILGVPGLWIIKAFWDWK